VECERALLQAGAPVEHAMQDGTTALMLACQEGHADCVRALLEAVAPVSTIDNGSFSVLARACPDLPLLQLLCVHGVPRYELTELELDEMPE
jgi:ankyrin repeat protein